MFNNHEIKRIFQSKIIVNNKISLDIEKRLESRIEGLYFTKDEAEIIEKALSLGNMHRRKEWEDRNLLEIQKRFVNSSSYIKNISDRTYLSRINKYKKEIVILRGNVNTTDIFLDKTEKLWRVLNDYLYVYEKLNSIKKILGQKFINAREKNVKLIKDIIEEETK